MIARSMVGEESQFNTNPGMRGPARKALIELFYIAFREVELRHFAYTQYVPINADLPTEEGLEDLAFKLVAVLERHNMIDEGLFRVLMARKPEWRREIHYCANLWGIDLADEWRSHKPSDKKRARSEPNGENAEKQQEEKHIFSLDIRFRGRRIFIGISVLALMFEPTRPEPAKPPFIAIADDPGVQHHFTSDILYAHGEPPSPAPPPGLARFHPDRELIELVLEPCAQDTPQHPIALRVVSEPESWHVRADPSKQPRAGTAAALRNLSDCVRDRMRFFRPLPGLQFSVTLHGAEMDFEVSDFGITQKP